MKLRLCDEHGTLITEIEADPKMMLIPVILWDDQVFMRISIESDDRGNETEWREVKFARVALHLV